MLKLLLPLLTVLLLWQRAASMDGLCRDCLCANSGGRTGNASNCVMPVPTDCFEGFYCGPYGMSVSYWLEAGAPTGDFYSCMGDWECANETLNAYTDMFCLPSFVGHSLPCSCEEQVRIHHCGPASLDATFCNTYYDNYFKPCMDESA